MAPDSAVTFVNGHQASAVGQGEVVCSDSQRLHRCHPSGSAPCPRSQCQPVLNQAGHDNGAQITSRDNRCFVSSKDTVTMEGVSQRDGTMGIRQSRQQPTYALAATAATKQSPELWHRRFGHLGYDNLFKLKNKHMVDGISVPAEAFKQQQQQKPCCEECTLAKQHRLPFPDSSSNRSSLLELVHMDVCAPFKSSQLKMQGTWQPSLMSTQDCAMLCHWGTSQKRHRRSSACGKLRLAAA